MMPFKMDEYRRGTPSCLLYPRKFNVPIAISLVNGLDGISTQKGGSG